LEISTTWLVNVGEEKNNELKINKGIPGLRGVGAEGFIPPSKKLEGGGRMQREEHKVMQDFFFDAHIV